ncbi:MAG: ribosome-binding factor A, partial [Coriobacteriia bacterium]|nr:ribosome-binding factor A [Coriobacteriia bacterium]
RDQYVSCAEALTKSAGRIRSLVAGRLSWRVAPELRFVLDTSVDQAERIGAALAAEAKRNEEVSDNTEEA